VVAAAAIHAAVVFDADVQSKELATQEIKQGTHCRHLVPT